jgi:putative transposase
MYDWQTMNEVERMEVLAGRCRKKHPAHELPHFFDGIPGVFFITGTNFQHQEIVGKSDSRVADFANRLLKVIEDSGFELNAYCLLRNHYHVLAIGQDVAILRKSLGMLHGRTSRWWNLEDATPGRKVWYRVFDTMVRSNRKYYSTLNYIHNNPVKLGLCEKVTDWPWSTAASFINEVGREEAIRIWKSYPFKQ